MRLLSTLAVFIFVFTFILSPVHAQTNNMTPAADETQSMENNQTAGAVDVAPIFWPIVPGTTVADGTFFLKQIRESLQGMFTFGNIAQAKYQTELSEKRIVEANKLIEVKDYGNAVKSIIMSEERRKAGIESKRKAAEAKEDTVELVSMMVDAFSKEKQVLEYFALAMPAEQKDTVNQQLKNIDLQISEAK